MYLLRMAGHQVLIMGSMNYIEREVDGLRPDIAIVGANANRREIYDYTGRLMGALGIPQWSSPHIGSTAVVLRGRTQCRRKYRASCRK